MNRRDFLAAAAAVAGVPVIMHSNLHPVPAYDRQTDDYLAQLKPWSGTTEGLRELEPAHAIFIECRVTGCADEHAWRRLALVEPTDIEGAIVMADLPVGTIVRLRYDQALRAELDPHLAPGLDYDFRARVTNLHLVKADDGAD